MSTQNFEGGSEAELLARQHNLAAKLDSRPIDWEEVPRSPDRYMSISDLTYNQIISGEAKPAEPDSCLPPGARLFADAEAECTLTEGHLADIDHYLLTGKTIAHPQELAGFRVKELQEVADYFDLDAEELLHPILGGQTYYRGYFIPINDGEAVLLFSPFMKPWLKHKAGPLPTLYTMGAPDITTVRTIARAYKDLASADR